MRVSPWILRTITNVGAAGLLEKHFLTDLLHADQIKVMWTKHRTELLNLKRLRGHLQAHGQFM